MSRGELLRWSGSIGIFYVLIPAYLVASERILRAVLPAPPTMPAGWAWRALLVATGLVGLWLVVASIRAQVTRGQGHPFDMTGRESFSRPTRVLLDDGVYALCRNPMGLGDLALYACLTGLTHSTWSLLLQVPAYALVVAWNHRINERPALLARFGDAYLEYERRTPLLIPGPRSLVRASRPGSAPEPR